MPGPPKVNDEQLLAAVPEAKNMRHLLQMLGLAAYGGNYESIRGRLAGLGVLEPPLTRAPWTRRQPPEVADLLAALQGSLSIAGVLRALALPESGAARSMITALIAREEIDTSHFTRQAWNRGRRFPKRQRPLSELLVFGQRCSTDKLRRRLLRDGVLPHACARCGGTWWNDAPIPLELDHVDGDRANNLLANLRLLCPNCHAQTDTYRGRNIRIEPSTALATTLLRDATVVRLLALRPTPPNLTGAPL